MYMCIYIYIYIQNMLNRRNVYDIYNDVPIYI